MSKTPFYKRQFYIKKKFQTDFSIKFLILIVIESVLAIALFVYLSKGTVITGYSGDELVVASTGEFFLPTLLLANLVVIGVTAIVGFVVLIIMSHRIAGPLYRFEKALDEVASGNLSYRFNLRSSDQLAELAASMNDFNSRMEEAVTAIKKEVDSLKGALEGAPALASSGEEAGELRARLDEALESLRRLEEASGYFTTSGGRSI